jgi:hypothetical protein
VGAFEGIEHVEIEPTTDAAGEPVPLLPEQPATLLVDWNGDDDRATALLAELVRGGVPIRSYTDDGGNLEDLFLQLTAREEHA